MIPIVYGDDFCGFGVFILVFCAGTFHPFRRHFCHCRFKLRKVQLKLFSKVSSLFRRSKILSTAGGLHKLNIHTFGTWLRIGELRVAVEKEADTAEVEWMGFEVASLASANARKPHAKVQA